MTLDLERYRTALAEETEGLASLLETADLAATVPTCPEWTLAYLGYHVGGAHRFGAAIARGDIPSPPTGASDVTPPPQPADAELPGWLRAGVGELRAAVDADPDGPTWGWTGPVANRYWLRRMTLETVMHRVDAALAAGTTHRPAADLAVDGVAEWLELITAPMVRATPRMHALRGNGERLAFETTDTGDRWLIVRTPDGPAAGEPGTADVTVTASAADLTLVLARRADPSTVTVSGDAAVFEHWLANTAF